MSTRAWPIFALSDLIENPFAGFWGADERSGATSVPVRAIRLADVSRGGMLDSENLQVRWFNRRETELAKCRPGDLVLVASGMETGSVCAVPEKDSREPVVVTNFLRRLRARPGLDQRWLYHVLSHRRIKSVALVHSGQTSVRNLSRSFFYNLKIPTPPTYEQRRIAAILDTLDDRIRVEELLIHKLERQHEGLLAELVLQRGIRLSAQEHSSPLAQIDAGWSSTRLGDAGKWLSGGTPSTDDPRYWDGEIPWISAASLKKFRINDSERCISTFVVSGGGGLLS